MTGTMLTMKRTGIVIQHVAYVESQWRRRSDFALSAGALAVAVLISVFGPLTCAGFNPARDVGPRIVASLAGWGAPGLRSRRLDAMRTRPNVDGPRRLVPDRPFTRPHSTRLDASHISHVAVHSAPLTLC